MPDYEKSIMMPSTVYRCRLCGHETSSPEKAQEHEARHFGLTATELRHWQTLKDKVRHASSLSARTHNQFTEAELDNAIKELMDFEEAHGLH